MRAWLICRATLRRKFCRLARCQLALGLQQMAQLQIDPNVESSGLDPSLFGAVAQVPPRRIFQRGARSFQWQAEDRNGDTLEYSIYYRPLNETTFRLLKDKLRDNFYTIDGATLADGRYIIKIIASDAPDNPLWPVAVRRTHERAGRHR